MSLGKLYACHNDILRRLLGEPRLNSASAMFVRSHLDNLIVLQQNLSFGLNLRLQYSNNVSLKVMYGSYVL